MKMTVNDKTISAVWDNNKTDYETEEYLNHIIEEELKKNSPDCDLIDECINALDELRCANGAEASIRQVITKRQIFAYCRRQMRFRTATRGMIAAALVAVMGSTAAFYTVPAFANSVKSLYEWVVYSLTTMATTTDEDSEVVSIYATLPNDGDINGACVTAVLRDGTERAVPLSACSISQTEEETEEGRYVLTVIAYKGCACSLITDTEEGVTD